ncbi:uncharacterized protein LOC111053624 [Nilaparvata lugens]|uniref:uncharacterized protein LOC111053624 n=1 Tax=Nilaparvata lugens TaxID=108931 RepID=UPI00193D9A10|nr:uncharacterized protein LOC111053624 [Nilaparvata lugens]
MIGFPYLENSLCGCTVKQGSKIIAWLAVISHLILFSLEVMAAKVAMDIMPDGHHNMIDPKVIIKAVTIFMAVVQGIGLASDLLLVIGVYTNRAGLMKAWIIIELIYIFLQLLSLFEQAKSISSLGMYLFGFCITYYSMAIVNSHCENLKSQQLA